MKADRWARVAGVFEAVIDLPPAERAARLDGLCGGDVDLRAQVVRLLDADASAGTFGETPAFRVAPDPEATAAPLAPGTRLGRYEIVSLVGAGGMGEVYRARDPQLARDVGIKVLPRRDGISAEQVARFAREARAAAGLNHSNILTVFDVGVDRDIPFVVSELLEGETLRARMKREAIPLDQATGIALQVASGLSAAHDKGIVHRDLKPENLFITSDGVVKILDFGLAKQIVRRVDPDSAITDQGLLMGTAGYMSPEQIRGEEADARSDIFSFGAVLYEMLSGERAFTGASPAETMSAVLTTEPSALHTLPPGLRTVVERCLASNPEDRFATARDVAAAWVAGSPAAPEASKPRRLVSYGIAAVVILAIASIGSVLLLRRQPAPPRPGAAGRPALAVLPFDDRSGDPAAAWLSTGVAGMLVTSLAQTPGLDVIGTERLEASFRDLGRAHSDRSARLEAARHAGAGAVLVGSLFTVGSDTRLDAQVQDVDTGRVVAASSHQGPDLFALVDAVARDVRGALDVANRPAGRPLRDVTTTSLEAYELYAKGQRARHNNRWNDARTLFEEALRVDPAFTLARAHLVPVLERLGDNAAAKPHRPIVASQLDRLPERHRLMAEAVQQYDSNPQQALQLLERLIERYPDEEEAYDSIIHAYTHAYDPAYARKALAFMQRWGNAIRGPGSGHFHNHYGYAYIEHGLFADAEREFRAYIRVSPDEANAYDSLAELYLMTGRPALTVETYDQALRLNPRFGWSHFGRVYALGIQGKFDEAFAGLKTLHTLGIEAGVPSAVVHMLDALLCSRVGRDADAAAHLAAARRLSREREDLGAAVDADLLDAMFAIERGEHARAIDHASRASTLTPAGRSDIMRVRRAAVAHLLAGVAEARAGRLDAARERLAAQQKLDINADRIQGSWQQMLAGEIALSEGQLDAADRAFRAAEHHLASSFAIHPIPVALANNFPFRDGLARTALARGDYPAAMDLYRRLNHPNPSSKWYSLFEPRYVLAAAKVAERAGNTAAARSERSRFAELWKGAQPAESRQAPPARQPASKAAAILTWPSDRREQYIAALDSFFLTRTVKAGSHPRVLARGRPLAAYEPGGSRAGDLERFMNAQRVRGLLVLEDGSVRLERYVPPHSPSTRWNSFSVAKSITSTLVGVAMKDGYIRSLDDGVTRYIAALRGSAYDGVTVRQLLTMTSGVKWNEDYADTNSDVARMYALPPARGFDMTVSYVRTLPREAPPGTKWVYKTAETNLVGVLVAEATGKRLADYLSDKIWRHYGMERDAEWMIDDVGHEQGGCCLAMTLRDYARFGQFILDGGRVAGARIVADDWLPEATRAQVSTGPASGYGYQWWTRDDGTFEGRGIYGQTLHIDPARRVVIVINSATEHPTGRESGEARRDFIAAIKSALEAAER